MSTLRTPEGSKKYHEYMDRRGENAGCALCEKEALKQFTHWKIVTNDFPYERIAQIHDMLIPLRHVTENALTAEELAEFNEIKRTHVAAEYEYLLEVTPKGLSIPGHFH